MSIKDNLSLLLAEIPPQVKLVAVSKTQTFQRLMEAYECGQRIFGENRAQDLKQRFELSPEDIEWHFIGHLQTNKVKYIAPKVAMIHSIDSFKLLEEVNKEARKHHRIIKCLLQFHIAEEETKYGLDMQEAVMLIEELKGKPLDSVKICGLMGMATYTNDDSQIHKEFRQLKSYFCEMQQSHFRNSEDFMELSMGMSGDYRIAIEEGSTIVRIGTSVFGI